MTPSPANCMEGTAYTFCLPTPDHAGDDYAERSRIEEVLDAVAERNLAPCKTCSAQTLGLVFHVGEAASLPDTAIDYLAELGARRLTSG